jgi:drug/metabolite transporter (DMT)-like permease
MPGLWIVFTVIAAGGQTLRNALQRELTKTLGTVGATHVRFLYGLPFGLLFLGIVLAATGSPLPRLTQAAVLWTTIGGISQICATALLLSAMQTRSFVVATAYSKTEPVLVALFGLIFLGDQLTLWLAAAIALGTLGVVVMSWPKSAVGAEAFTWQPAVYGVGSAALFGLAATGFRGGILALGQPNFVVAASTILALGLVIQTVLLTAYLLVREPQTLMALFRAWRPSGPAGFMGAFASQMWFLAFAIEAAAKVRTLALIEIFFAQLISRTLFKQSLASREGLGIAMIVISVIALLWQ